MTTMVVNAFNWNGFASWYKNKKAVLARDRAYRQTVAELEKLSDRELRDIGINRADIHSIAMETHYDNIYTTHKGWI
jgi:uncharacterized protein YjiS (DUF1127 family)